MKLLDFVDGITFILYIGLFLCLYVVWNTKAKIDNIKFFAKISFYGGILELIRFVTIYLVEKYRLEDSDYLSSFLCVVYIVLYLFKKNNIVFYFFWYSVLNSLTFFVASFFMSDTKVTIITTLAFGFLFNLWLYTYIKKNQDPNSPVLS